MSEPIQGCGELNEPQKGIGEFVVAGGDSAMGFDATEEVFDLPAVAVVATMKTNRVTTAALGRDTRTAALAVQPCAKVICIESPVCHQTVPAGRPQHRESGEEIVALTAIQAYGEGATPSIDHRGELCIESTLGPAHRLGGLATPRIGAMLVELDVRAVEVSQRADGLAAKLSKNASEQALAAPQPEPAVDGLPFAVSFGEISPRTAGAQHEKNTAENQTVILSRSSSPSSGTSCNSPAARAIRSIFLAAPSAARESSVDLNRTWLASDCVHDHLFHQFSNTP